MLLMRSRHPGMFVPQLSGAVVPWMLRIRTGLSFAGGTVGVHNVGDMLESLERSGDHRKPDVGEQFSSQVEEFFWGLVHSSPCAVSRNGRTAHL